MILKAFRNENKKSISGKQYVANSHNASSVLQTQFDSQRKKDLVMVHIPATNLSNKSHFHWVKSS